MTYISVLRVVVTITVLLSMSGCAALSAIGDSSTPLEVYELRPPVDISETQARPLQRDLTVELPTTSGALETDRIMIRPNSLQAQYLPKVRWSEPTPVMVQTLMLRSIEATQGVRYVARRPLGARGDYAIVTEVIDFQAELNEDGETAIVKLRLISRIVREEDVSIVASKTFSASAIASSVETESVIDAFDAAAGRLFRDFADWVILTLK